MAVIVQPRMPPVTARLLAVTLGLSLAAAVDWQLGGNLYYQLALVPEAVWSGQVWRLATWPFVMGGPLTLIFSCVVLYVFGSDLLAVWGARRYLRYLAAIIASTGVTICLLGLLVPGVSWLPQLGGMALADAVTIAWARRFPDQPVHFYLLLVLRGRQLVNAVVATTVLFAVFFGIAWMLPELLAVAAALLLTDRAFRRWWLTRKLERIRRHLRVIT